MFCAFVNDDRNASFRRRAHGWQLLATSLADVWANSLQLDLFILTAAKDALLFAMELTVIP
jgi:hypothetical protein